MRALFFGSPAFAVPSLDALAQIAEVAAVITQPDRRKGRGMRVSPPPVKQRALELGLKVMQPTKVRTAEFAQTLEDFEADVSVVVAYGRILPLAVLQAARSGSLNVHASLLPRWRGAAPIQWCIVEGDQVSGVSLMQMDEGMDTGAVLAMRQTPIGSEESAGELSERLSVLGAELLADMLPRFFAGELQASPQDDAKASNAPLLKKSDGEVDWHQSSQRVHDRVRGMHPWPGATTYLAGTRFKILKAGAMSLAPTPDQAPGTVMALDRDGLVVACQSGSLRIDILQQEGRRQVSAEQVKAAGTLQVGMRFTSARQP